MRALPEIPSLNDRSDDLTAACTLARRKSGRDRPASVTPASRPSPAQPPRVATHGWVRAVALGVVVAVLLVVVGAVLAGCAFSEPLQRLVAHVARDAGTTASAHPEDPAAARLVTASAALVELVGEPEVPVVEAQFEGDVAAVREEATARGRASAAMGSAVSAVGTLLAGVLGTIVTVIAGPAVVRRVGIGIGAGVRWARGVATRAGVPEALVETVVDEAAAQLSGKRDAPPTKKEAPTRRTAAPRSS